MQPLQLIAVVTRDSHPMKRSFLLHMQLITYRLFWDLDTTTVRLLLGLSSLGWALSAWENPVAFRLKSFEIIAATAPAGVWCTMFMLHGVGVLWRFFDPTPRPVWALIINSFGLLLWTTISVMAGLALSTFSPFLALEVVVCLFAGWTLYRTGLREEIVTP